MYHDAPSPPSIYTSEDITPKPEKLGATLMMGTFVGYTSGAVSLAASLVTKPIRIHHQ